MTEILNRSQRKAEQLSSELVDAVNATEGLECDISKLGDDYFIVIHRGYELVFEKRVTLPELYGELDFVRVLVQSGII